MKIKNKIVITFSLILLVFSIIISWVIYNKINTIIYENYTKNIKSSSELGYSYFDSKYHGDWYIKDNKLYKGNTLINDNFNVLDGIKNTTGFYVTIFMKDTRISTNVLDDKGNRAVGTKAADEVIEKVLNNGKDYIGQAKVVGQDSITYYKPIFNSNNEVIGMWFMGANKTSANNEIISIIIFIIGIIAVMLMIGVGVSYVFGDTIVKAINAVKENLNNMSKGDFSKEISKKHLTLKDEIGDIARASLKLTQDMRGIINVIIEESNSIDKVLDLSQGSIKNLNESIEDVSATTEQLSAGMQQTAASMEEMNATSQEIESSVALVAIKSKEGHKSAKDINKKSSELSNVFRESASNTNDIYSANENKLKIAIERSQSIEKIKELSEAILSISAQTNLLALNAAIEAARVGDAGRGFAVVAEEIRQLAENSKVTVIEIQKVTNEVLDCVDNLVNSSRELLEFVDNQIINDYKMFVDSGENYSNDSRHIDNIMMEVSSSTEILYASIENVSKAINQVTIATNEGADGITNIAEKSIKVSENADEVKEFMDNAKRSSNELKRYVSQFKIA